MSKELCMNNLALKNEPVSHRPFVKWAKITVLIFKIAYL